MWGQSSFPPGGISRTLALRSAPPIREPVTESLRIFSGKQPVTPWEEEYKTWMEQAMQAVEE